MARVTWDKLFNVGNKELDAQHKELIHFMNEVYERLESSVNVGDYDDFFDKLKKHAEEHFSTEEKYFSKTHYKDAASHTKQHTQIKAQIARLEEEFNEHPSTEKVFATLQFLDDWLFKHIILSDKKYEEHFKKHKLL